MKLIYTGLYTAEQMLRLFSAWDVVRRLPPKGKKVIVSIPNKRIYTITLHTDKNTYGKTLYKSVLTEH